MKTCEQYQELFIESLYNELSPDKKIELEKHLDSCPECSTAYKKLEATLNVMNQRERVELDEEYWKSYWNKLNTSLENEKESKSERRNVFPIRFAWQPAWSYGIAATLLLAVGLYLGKIMFSNSAPEVHQPLAETFNIEQETNKDSTISNQEETRISNPAPAYGGQESHISHRTSVTVAARSYLDRSKIMLLGLINSDDDASLSFSRQRKVSRTLLHEAADLKPRLVEPDQQRIKQLIDELEVILLQLANFEEQSDLPAIELVKKGVDEKAILLKINMEEMRAMSKSDSTTKKQSNKQKSSL